MTLYSCYSIIQYSMVWSGPVWCDMVLHCSTAVQQCLMFLIACLFSRCIKCNTYLVVSQCSIASLVFQHSNEVVVEASITMQYRSNICNIQSDIQPVVLHQLHAIYHMYSRNIYICITYIYIQIIFRILMNHLKLRLRGQVATFSGVSTCRAGSVFLNL